MTTSNELIPAPPLRLRMTTRAGTGTLDGGWWPHSRDLAVELADLVEHFPAASGRVIRAVVSPPDWETAPRQVKVARGFVKVGSFPHDDTHVILLGTADRTTLRLLVVPPDMTDDQGAEALLAAGTDNYTHSAGCLLDTVSEHPDVDPAQHWTHEGDSWRDRADGPVGC